MTTDGTWMPMTEVLHELGERQLTPAARERIATALDARGLVAEPDIATIGRSQLVRLLPREHEQAELVVRSVTRWRGTDWFDLGTGAAAGTLPPGFDPALLEELRRPDVRPFLHPLGGGLWMLSTVALQTREDGHAESTAGTVCVLTVELLIGPDWIVSCWNGLAAEAPASVLDTVREVWDAHPGARSPYTLATIFLAACAIEYADVIETLDAWYDQWQLAHHDPGQEIGRDTLFELRRMVIDLRRQVGPLLELLDKLRDEWPPPEDDPAAFNHALDHAERRTFATLKALEHLAETLQASFGILAAQDTEHQRAQTDRLHDRLDVVSAVFLVPALIAGIYGANTAIPGGGSWWGFVAMCVLMFLGVTLALLYLGKFPYEPLMRRWPKSLRRKRHRA
jgi:Mg2+ and Co2+ transporter CorA